VEQKHRRAFIRLLVFFGAIPVAYVAARITGSDGVFVGVMAVGLLVSLVLLALWR
jgi:hypothetical protein